jgi:hypothetical protein
VPSRSRSAVVGLAVVIGAGAMCSSCSSSSSAKGPHSATTTSLSIPLQTTSPEQLPSPFGENQKAGLPGDLAMMVTSARREGGQIVVDLNLENDRTTPLSLAKWKSLFSFRSMFFGGDAAPVGGTVPATVPPNTTRPIVLRFADPGVKVAQQPTLYFHGLEAGSDKATFALLDLLKT